MWPVYGSLIYGSSNPDRPYFRCQETDANEKCDFFQWADIKSVKKKRKRNDLKKVTKGKRFKKGENTGIIRGRGLRLFTNIILELGLYVSLYRFLL